MDKISSDMMCHRFNMLLYTLWITWSAAGYFS